jgi:hypothetical protein
VGFGLVNTGFAFFEVSSEYLKNFFVTMLRISLCLRFERTLAEGFLRWG